MIEIERESSYERGVKSSLGGFWGIRLRSCGPSSGCDVASQMLGAAGVSRCWGVFGGSAFVLSGPLGGKLRPASTCWFDRLRIKRIADRKKVRNI